MFVSLNSNLMGTTNGAETAYPSWSPEFIPFFVGGDSCCSIFSVLYSGLYIMVVFSSLPRIIGLSVLFRITTSNFTFGIFKIIFLMKTEHSSVVRAIYLALYFQNSKTSKYEKIYFLICKTKIDFLKIIGYKISNLHVVIFASINWSIDSLFHVRWAAQIH